MIFILLDLQTLVWVISVTLSFQWTVDHFTQKFFVCVQPHSLYPFSAPEMMPSMKLRWKNI